MMQFFRKYQRFFFIFLTTIIIISFSFFGTYSSLASRDIPDPVAFVDLGGKKVHQSEVDALVRFIGSDAEDKILSGGVWGPNFLNDGVLKKDFLQTGLAEVIALPHLEALKNDLESKLTREKTFQTYKHPQAPFLGSEAIWEYFAPQMKKDLAAIRSSNTVDEDLFKAKLRLFLAQEKFPQHYMKQILSYQQKEYQGLPPDPYLNQRDLSLFGYHSVEDWFGPKFLQLSAEVIINAAAAAEQKGIVVKDEDVLADLLYNNQFSFNQMQKSHNPYLGVTNSNEYFKEQLRLLGMDQKGAIKAWKQVMLFRALIATSASAVAVDPLLYDQFHEYASKGSAIVAYQLPPDLHLANALALQKFETYLNLVAPPRAKPVDLPKQLKTLDQVSKDAPELVETPYELKIAAVSDKDIQLNVSLRDAWAWELDDANWPTLMLKFKELGSKLKMTKDEKFKVLEALDPRMRFAVDSFAREQIAKDHPEWIEQLLVAAPSKKMTVGIRLKGDITALAGIKDPQALKLALDEVQIADNGEGSSSDKLKNYTQDHHNYYRIEVIDREDPRVLTFAESLQAKLLDRPLDKYLEEAYKKNPQGYGEGKKFADVKAAVATKLFTPLYDAIAENAKGVTGGYNADSGVTLADYAARHRFDGYVASIRSDVIKGINDLVVLKDSDELNAAFDEQAASLAFDNQFKLIEEPQTISRSLDSSFEVEEALSLKSGEYSPVLLTTAGEPYFIKKEADVVSETTAATLMKQGQKALADEASKVLLQDLVKDMIKKDALLVEHKTYKDLPKEG